jgi:hypothetical protein
MNIKKTILTVLVLCLGASLLTAAAPKKVGPFSTTSAVFKQGDKFVTPQLGINTWAIPFGASFEYAITGNIGLGATVMAWFWSGASVILPSADVAYHFTMLKVDKLDLYAGGAVGFAIYNAGGGVIGDSGIYLSPFTGARYWFSKKMAGSVRVNFGLIGDWTGVGAVVGVTFKL